MFNQQLGTPQVLYDRPANMFVAGFIGSPAMNFFEAKLDRKDGGAVVDLGSFQLPLDLVVDMGKMHVFERGSGRRLL